MIHDLVTRVPVDKDDDERLKEKIVSPVPASVL